MPENNDDQSLIERMAESPKRVTGDEGTVEERTIPELIAADKYEENKKLKRNPFKVTQVEFPGTP